MSFGRNPHVAKAEAAEQKARDARDPAAYEQAWREAARQWERAAAREKLDKRRVEYTEKADAARANADADAPLTDIEVEPPAAFGDLNVGVGAEMDGEGDGGTKKLDAKLLN